jgi:hypothetical protein
MLNRPSCISCEGTTDGSDEGDAAATAYRWPELDDPDDDTGPAFSISIEMPVTCASFQIDKQDNEVRFTEPVAARRSISAVYLAWI